MSDSTIREQEYTNRFEDSLDGLALAYALRRAGEYAKAADIVKKFMNSNIGNLDARNAWVDLASGLPSSYCEPVKLVLNRIPPRYNVYFCHELTPSADPVVGLIISEAQGVSEASTLDFLVDALAGSVEFNGPHMSDHNCRREYLGGFLGGVAGGDRLYCSTIVDRVFFNIGPVRFSIGYAITPFDLSPSRPRTQV